MGTGNETPNLPSRRVWSRTISIIGMVTALILLLAFLHYLVNAVLILFMGVVIGVLLEGFTNFISRSAGIPHWLALVMALIVIIAGLTGAGWLIASRASVEIGQLRKELPDAIDNLEQQLHSGTVGRTFLEILPLTASSQAQQSKTTAAISEVSGVVWTTFEVLANTIVVLLIALYMAAEPMLYSAGIVLLVPPQKRNRLIEVLHQTAASLRWWIVGRLVAMLVIGVLAGVGLWLLGVKLPIALGLITGLFEFVPIAGAWAGGIVAVLIAFMSGKSAVLYVIALYLGIHLIEGYILVPLIQRRAILVPPALLLGSQLIFTVLFGVLGIIVAAPIVAISIPLIKLLYVEDVLGQKAANLLNIQSEKDLAPRPN